MTKLLRTISLFCAGSLCGWSDLGAAVIDFGDVPLFSPPTQAYTGPGGGVYYNGSDNAGGFLSGGATWKNTFTDFGGGFTAWSGFAYANTTDTTTAGFGNQYSAYPGGGAGDAVYGVGYASAGAAEAILPVGLQTPLSVKIANSTYAALSMLQGDDFAKKFGGLSGNDPDYFRLTITGRQGAIMAGQVEFYLADYRSAENSLDTIVTGWATVDLSSLGSGITSLEFSLASTDNGPFGMNTPGYFAVDDLVVVPEPSWLGFLTFLVGCLYFRRRE